MSKINEVNSDSHQTTGFFTNVAAFSLPPETWNLIRTDYGKAEMKVILCLLLAAFEVGHQAEDLGFNDIVELTEMNQSSVSRALAQAQQRGCVLATTTGYRIALKTPVAKKQPMTCHESCLNHEILGHGHEKHDSCHELLFENDVEKRHEIFSRLSAIGLASKVAHDLAYGDRYDLERIERQIEYYEFERDNQLLPAKLRNVPGYVVNRIKFDRQAPKAMLDESRSWYTDDEAELMQR